jgi:hypothetical protein
LHLDNRLFVGGERGQERALFRVRLVMHGLLEIADRIDGLLFEQLDLACLGLAEQRAEAAFHACLVRLGALLRVAHIFEDLIDIGKPALQPVAARDQLIERHVFRPLGPHLNGQRTVAFRLVPGGLRAVERGGRHAVLAAGGRRGTDSAGPIVGRNAPRRKRAEHESGEGRPQKDLHRFYSSLQRTHSPHPAQEGSKASLPRYRRERRR